MKQVRFAREHDQQTQLAAAGVLVSGGEVIAARPEVVPESHAIFTGDKVSLLPTNFELETNSGTKEDQVGNISYVVGGQVSVDVSADAGIAGKGSDLPPAESQVSKVLDVFMSQVLGSERQSKAKMVEDFEKLLEQIAAKHHGDVKALQTGLAEQEQRNAKQEEIASKHAADIKALQMRLAEEAQGKAQLVEVKREMEESHARDINVLEGMVQRSMEENERLVCDVKTWKAAANRRPSSNVSTSSGDESGVPSLERSTTSSPKLGAITPRSDPNVSSGSDVEVSGSPDRSARVHVKKVATPRV